MRTAARLCLRPMLALLAGGLLAGCSLTSNKGLPVGNATPAISQVALDLEDASVGAKEHPRLVQGFGGVYRDTRLEAVLNGVVADLVPASERPDLRYQVTILNSPSVNAFALPGGYLYVTRGLLALANEPSEIAAVLAHEMAHVTARHAAEREDKARSAVLASRVLSEIMRDERAGAVALAASQVSLAGFSRKQELEADAIGIATIARAGYDPAAASRFLVSMGRQSEIDQQRAKGERKDQSFLASHPTTPDRVQRAASLAKVAARKAPSGRTPSREGYLLALDGILYGDDSKEGYARGRRFVHTELGFLFDAPEGFTLENSPRAVFGIGPNGEAMRFDGARLPGSGPPVELVASGWIDGAQVSQVRAIIVDGLPAATALATASDWTFRLGAIRRGEMVYRFVLGAKEFTAELDRVFLDAIRSFRRIKPGEGAAKPVRVRIVQAGPSDTIASLARRMEVDGDKLERFLVLNGLKAGDTLAPGTPVKILVSGDDTPGS